MGTAPPTKYATTGPLFVAPSVAGDVVAGELDVDLIVLIAAFGKRPWNRDAAKRGAATFLDRSWLVILAGGAAHRDRVVDYHGSVLLTLGAQREATFLIRTAERGFASVTTVATCARRKHYGSAGKRAAVHRHATVNWATSYGERLQPSKAAQTSTAAANAHDSMTFENWEGNDWFIGPKY